MKKMLFVVVLSVASLSFATNTIDVNTTNETVKCSLSINTSTTTNPDGSSTQTTTTSASCDTAQELAELHASLKALGMGI